MVLMKRTGGDGHLTGEVGQAVSQLLQVLRRHDLAEAGEADQVGERDRDQARPGKRHALGPLGRR